jgi:Ankyrin repeats (3 copies)
MKYSLIGKGILSTFHFGIMKFIQCLKFALLILEVGICAMEPAPRIFDLKEQEILLEITASENYLEDITTKINAHPQFKDSMDDKDFVLSIISLLDLKSFPKEFVAIMLNSRGAQTWVKNYTEKNAAAKKNLTDFLIDMGRWEKPNLIWAERILQAGISANALDKGDVIFAENPGAEALGTASSNGQLDLVALLLKYKAGTETKSPWDSRTALMDAALYGHSEIVKLLLEHKANPNATNCFGITSLMWAAKHKHVETVQLLIDAQADVNMKDTVDSLSSQKSQSALDKAKERTFAHDEAGRNEYKKIITLLENAGAQ